MTSTATNSIRDGGLALAVAVGVADEGHPAVVRPSLQRGERRRGRQRNGGHAQLGREVHERAVVLALNAARGRTHLVEEGGATRGDLDLVVGVHRSANLVIVREDDVAFDRGEVGVLGEALLVYLEAADDLVAEAVGDDRDDGAEHAVLAGRDAVGAGVGVLAKARNHHAGAILDYRVGVKLGVAGGGYSAGFAFSLLRPSSTAATA